MYGKNELDCVIALASMTYALRGEGILRSAGIPVRIVRLSPGQTTRGCSHGLAINSINHDAARRALDNYGIPAGETVR